MVEYAGGTYCSWHNTGTYRIGGSQTDPGNYACKGNQSSNLRYSKAYIRCPVFPTCRCDIHLYKELSETEVTSGMRCRRNHFR